MSKKPSTEQQSEFSNEAEFTELCQRFKKECRQDLILHRNLTSAEIIQQYENAVREASQE